jgi:hypothetical protein
MRGKYRCRKLLELRFTAMAPDGMQWCIPHYMPQKNTGYQFDE